MSRLTWIRRLFASHLVVRLALLAALAYGLAHLLAPTTFHFRSGDLSVRLAPALPGGRTVLHLGPFGDLSWHTHATPVNLEATFVLHPDVQGLPTLKDARDVRVAFLLRRIGWVVLCGLLAGALLAEGMGRRTPIAAFLGGGLAAAAAGLLVLASVLTYNPHALANPHYRGPIQDAPRVLQLLKEAQSDFAGVQRNINNVVLGLERIHAQIVDGTNTNAATAQAATRILLISDLHNNPVGLLIARQLVERFHVDAVLDAGDFTDRGTQIEGELFARFGRLGVPQIIVAGNHEDRGAIARVSSIKGVRFLTPASDLAEVNGISILGDPDPNSEVIGDDPYDATALAQIPARCERLARRYAAVLPEILIVHDPRQGDCAAERARAEGRPLIFLWGHTHRVAYEKRGTVLGISAGTSGANGIKSPRKAPYGFALLEFDAARALLSSCEFTFSGPGELEQAACHIASRT